MSQHSLILERTSKTFESYIGPISYLENREFSFAFIRYAKIKILFLSRCLRPDVLFYHFPAKKIASDKQKYVSNE